MNKKIILSLLIAGFVFAGQSAFADSATLSASPASATKNVGTSFTVNVQVNPLGNKVCVVKGTLNFDNLSCSNITVASGLMAQTAPTCASPTFSIGIPKCSTDLQNIMTVSVKGKSAGQANLTFTGAKLIGAGVNVVSSQQPGQYDITAVQQPAKVEKIVEKPVETTIQQTQTQTPEKTQETLVTQQPAALANSAPSKVFTIGGIILLLMVIAFGLWKKFSKKKDKQA